MSPDVIIRIKISFVGCILIIAATELSKISRSLFIALQWRRISILFDSDSCAYSLVYWSYWIISIVLSLFLNHVSSFDISPLLL